MTYFTKTEDGLNLFTGYSGRLSPLLSGIPLGEGDIFLLPGHFLNFSPSIVVILRYVNAYVTDTFI
jgi:hypothetical protein